jgi:heat shock protein 90kDa beta
MESGFSLNDPKEFASSIYNSVQKSLDIADATVEEEEEETETPESEEKEPEGDDGASLKDEL